ncbi:MAG: hypothetical protein LBP22_14850 [Deltaproteobacteria bacterium]|nr:hypothetical protein [Deltaproteobacteria bacterium]
MDRPFFGSMVPGICRSRRPAIEIIRTLWYNNLTAGQTFRHKPQIVPLELILLTQVAGQDNHGNGVFQSSVPCSGKTFIPI